jgi:hypothetical protein
MIVGRQAPPASTLFVGKRLCGWGFEAMQAGDAGHEHNESMRFASPARHDALFAAFRTAHEKAGTGTYRCKDRGLGEAAASVAHFGQRAAINRLGLPSSGEVK